MSRTVLITDAGRGSSIGMIRALGRRGWKVVAGDTKPRSAGFSSRYTAESFVYPSPFVEPADRTAEAILGAAARHDVDLVIPITDDAMLPLAAARDQVPAGLAVAMPEPTALEAVTDKSATMALAADLGIPAPRTVGVTSPDQGRGLVGRFGRPVVCKPARSRVMLPDGRLGKTSVSYAADEAELEAQLRSHDGRCVLVQEYYRGEGHGLGLLLHEGRPLVAFQHRRLREFPVTGGPSSLRDAVPVDPTLLDQSTRLLAAIGWTGLAMVEFKVGEDGPRLMEVNGRVWGSLPLALHSGVDFANRLADLLLDGPPDAAAGVDTEYRVGTRSRNLDLEVLWIGSTLRAKHRFPYLPAPSRREGLAAALQLVRPGHGFDVLSREDPRPALAELRQLVSHLTEKVRHAR